MKVRLPLQARSVGPIRCPWPVVALRVKDRYGGWATIPFLLDTGADLTTIAIPYAARQAIPFRETTPGLVRGLMGTVEKFRDRIRVRIAGRDHDWPCDFTRPATGSEGKLLSHTEVPVLGRAGFLDDFAITLDSGYLILTRLGPFDRWWRRLRHGLWRQLGMVHNPEKPL